MPIPPQSAADDGAHSVGEPAAGGSPANASSDLIWRDRALDTLPDLNVWRESPDFVRLWWSGLISTFGSVFAMVAVPLQLADLTHSPLVVGAVGAVELVPTVLFALYGGAIADSFDRRRVAVFGELALGGFSAVLLANAVLGAPRVWLLFVVAACVAAVQGITGPALEAALPRVVARESLPAAVAWSSVQGSVVFLVGPVVAGLGIALAGVGTAYALDVVSFAVSALLLARLSAIPPSPTAEPVSFAGVGRALAYAWHRPVLVGTYATDLAATLLAFPIALYPFLADMLHARWALGLLYSATGLGALAASVTAGWVARSARHGRGVLACSAVLGACMVGVGVSGHLWLVLALLTIAGAAHGSADILRATVWNMTIPDDRRGRLAGIELLVGTGGPQLGDLRAGAVGARVGINAAIWSGGAACLGLTALIGAAARGLWGYELTITRDVRMRSGLPRSSPGT